MKDRSQYLHIDFLNRTLSEELQKAKGSFEDHPIGVAGALETHLAGALQQAFQKLGGSQFIVTRSGVHYACGVSLGTSDEDPNTFQVTIHVSEDYLEVTPTPVVYVIKDPAL